MSVELGMPGGGGILEVNYEEKVSGISSSMENLVLAYRHGCSKRLVRVKQEREPGRQWTHRLTAKAARWGRHRACV